MGRLVRGIMAAAALATCAAEAPAGAQTAGTYSWRTVPYGGGGYVDGFVYHPREKNLLYARTDIGGVYRFDFAAKRWIPLLDGLSRDDGDLKGVLSFALDPNDPNKIYLASGLYLGTWAHLAAVLRSDDRGVTWQKTDLPIRLGGNADGRGTGERLQVDPNAGNVLFLGSNQDGLWRSGDGGKTFAKAASFPAANLTLLLFDPSSGSKGTPSQIIYAGTGEGKGGLLVSRDGGASFAAVTGAPKQTPQHAVIGPDGFLYVAFAAGDGKSVINPSNALDGGVWKMDLKTGHWTDITPIKPIPGQATFGYSGIDADPAHPGSIVVSTLDRWWPKHDDIFVSRDGGAHWTSLESQANHDTSKYPWLANNQQVNNHGTDLMGSWISDVKINPFNPEEIVYGTGYGLWMSRNLTAAGTGKPVVFDFAVDNFEETATTQLLSPTGGATLMASFGDVAGAAWDDVTKTPRTGIFAPNTESNWSVDVAPLKPAFVARSTDHAPYGYYSENGGGSWTAFPSAPPFTPQDAKGNWRTIGPLAVSAAASAILWAPQRATAYYSFDRGKSWTAANGWPADDSGRLVPVADKVYDKIFYVHDRTGGKILISVDGGASFKPVIAGLPAVQSWENAQLVVAPGRARDLWLAGPFGLLHSPESAKPMSAIKGVDAAWLVSFGKTPPGRTYPAIFLSGKIGGQEGIWRSDDEGKSWTRINDDAHRFGGLSALSADPLEYGTVYIAPGGRGIVMGTIGH
jgi:hypothetical protein